MGAVPLGGGSEVLILQASASFFAYEPILKALQTAAPLPLAHALLPGAAGGDAAAQTPAFAVERGMRYDLSCLLTEEGAAGLRDEQRDRCGRVGAGVCVLIMVGGVYLLWPTWKQHLLSRLCSHAETCQQEPRSELTPHPMRPQCIFTP